MNELNNSRISDLIIKYLKDELSREERDILNNWVSEEPENARLFNEMVDPETLTKSVLELVQVRNAIEEQLSLQGWQRPQAETQSTKRIFQIRHWRWTAAAAVLLVAGIFMWKNDLVPSSPTAPPVTATVSKDIEPDPCGWIRAGVG
ncbi:MAG: hypothetical protein J7578_03560 [Chitinophagaceae bacterium]|nr:hypothetical protein [Chitinophagaceae bacterium]